MSALTPETITRVRARYLAGDPVRSILEDADITSSTLYHWIDGGPDEGEGPRLAPLPRRHQSLRARSAPRTASRLGLVKRLWRTAEWQVRDIEDRLRRNQQPAGERERDARMLAVIVKTVRELAAMRDKNEEDQEDDNAGLEDFRRELARRIDVLAGRRSAVAAGGDEQT
jgi:hypothetical protein